MVLSQPDSTTAPSRTDADLLQDERWTNSTSEMHSPHRYQLSGCATQADSIHLVVGTMTVNRGVQDFNLCQNMRRRQHSDTRI